MRLQKVDSNTLLLVFSKHDGLYLSFFCRFCVMELLGITQKQDFSVLYHKNKIQFMKTCFDFFLKIRTVPKMTNMIKLSQIQFADETLN